MGLKEELLGLEDREIVEVEVKQWGGRKVRVAAMSAAERDQYELESYEEAELAKKEGRRVRNVRARMLVQCLVDELGQRIFTTADIDALGGKSAAALDRLYSVAQRLNGYSLKDVKDLEKN